jgi:hypothetical protein
MISAWNFGLTLSTMRRLVMNFAGTLGARAEHLVAKSQHRRRLVEVDQLQLR